MGKGRRRNAVASLKGTAGAEKEAKTEDYESLDRLIDSITKDFSRKRINSRLKALARKSRNAATICDHILRSKPSIISKSQLQRARSRLCIGCQDT